MCLWSGHQEKGERQGYLKSEGRLQYQMLMGMAAKTKGEPRGLRDD